MKNSLKIFFFLSALVFVSALQSYSQTAAQFKLGVGHGSSLYSNKEQFEFSLGGEKVILNSTNPVVYFTRRFASGERYSVVQTSGPRTCNLFGANDRNFFRCGIIILSANCGYPPLSIFKLAVTGIEQGEIFKFADNYRQNSQYPFSTTANLGGYPQGDDYSVTQTAGPRQCRMSLNQGTVPASPLTVRADCAKTTGGPTTTTTTTRAHLINSIW